MAKYIIIGGFLYGKEERDVYKVKELMEKYYNFFITRIENIDIKDDLHDLLGGTIKSILDAEIDEHLGI